MFKNPELVKLYNFKIISSLVVNCHKINWKWFIESRPQNRDVDSGIILKTFIHGVSDEIFYNKYQVYVILHAFYHLQIFFKIRFLKKKIF